MTIDDILAQDFHTLPELIRLHAAQRPGHIALRQDARSLDYRALDALADRIAASLQRDGVKPKQAIAICAGTSIISGGFNVYPSDLEAVLRGHVDVAESAVVGVPSERWGETPVAFVVPKRRDPQLQRTLLDWANRQLGKTQRLAAIELVESLPRNAIGKVLKRELRDGYKATATAPS